MAIFRCKMCGGDLEIYENEVTCTCEFCGTEQTLPRLDSDKKTNLYDRANHFRRNNDYDKAMSIYEQILNEDNTDSEAYWSLVLCRYGIEYVEDPTSHKRIPTINRAQYTSIYADENYKSALEYANAAQKIIYEQEAKTIDKIQKGILAISEKETPFDVFICYKETDETGRRTPDSVLANDLYHQLTREGFKVFFARITLEDKLGQEYEPYIFAALNSSKVMVVLGTKPDYFKAVWVRNEWSRYLSLIHSGAKKMLIPAYKDMDPYDLPEEFSHLQAQDMTKLGFMQDLIRGIEKILGTDKKQENAKETVVVQQGGDLGNSAALLKRGYMALEDGDWQKADEFFEKVLNQDAENAESYLGKWMAKEKKSNIAALTSYYVDMYEDVELKRLEACEEATEHIDKFTKDYAVENYLFADELRKLYKFDRSYESELSCREEQKSKAISAIQSEKLYTRANQYAKGEIKNTIDAIISTVSAKMDDRIASARAKDNTNIASIKESYTNHIASADQKVKELHEGVLKRREDIYQTYIARFHSAEKIYEYRALKREFNNMHGYKDSVEYIMKCDAEIEKIVRIQAEEEKRRKKIRAIVTVVLLLCLVFVFLLIFVIIPNNKYNAAGVKFRNGDYGNALEAYRNLTGYKDSNDKIAKCEANIIKNASKGDTIVFGNYDSTNEWIVLDKQNDKVLIISKYAICVKKYNEQESRSMTWEMCTLRAWLNETYLTSAFSSFEQVFIACTTVVNGDNTTYGTDGGNNTTDKVFLLSHAEVIKYFPSTLARYTTLTDGTSIWWWLRSPGWNRLNSSFVDTAGTVNVRGDHIDNMNGGVRPALWIDISDL